MVYHKEMGLDDNEAERQSDADDLEDLPLTEEERQFTFRVQRRRWRWRPQWPKNDSPFWKFYSLFMTAFGFILLLTAVHESTNREDSACAMKHSHNELGEAHSTPANSWNKNVVERVFYRDLRYMTLDHDMDYLWQEHLFMATGNIRIPPQDGEGNASLKSIAMFHQMHCLAKLRLVLQEAREGIKPGLDWKNDAHWPHCFDMLRMSILCYADPTLESVSLQPGPREGTFVKVIDGAAEKRYCRDSSPLYELERRYGPNSEYRHNTNTDFEVAPGR